MTHKPFAPIAILSIAAIGLVVAAVWHYKVPHETNPVGSRSQSKNPAVSTSTWRTYIDPQYHFSFVYPASSTITNEVGGAFDLEYLTLHSSDSEETMDFEVDNSATIAAVNNCYNANAASGTYSYQCYQPYSYLNCERTSPLKCTEGDIETPLGGSYLEQRGVITDQDLRVVMDATVPLGSQQMDTGLQNPPTTTDITYLANRGFLSSDYVRYMDFASQIFTSLHFVR
jgi:hypothetical protein